MKRGEMGWKWRTKGWKRGGILSPVLLLSAVEKKKGRRRRAGSTQQRKRKIRRDEKGRRMDCCLVAGSPETPTKQTANPRMEGCWCEGEIKGSWFEGESSCCRLERKDRGELRRKREETRQTGREDSAERTGWRKQPIRWFRFCPSGANGTI